MANAAAKKSRSAQKKASSTYKPILIGINALYILILVVRNRDTYDRYQFCGSCVLWFLTIYSYNGILSDHANKSGASSSGGAGGKKRGSSSDDPLAGGDSLDLLGITVVVQFGTALVSDRFWWVLAVIPPWYGYKLYKTFSGALGGFRGGNAAANEPAETKGEGKEDEASAARRQKRAERRRTKWS